MKALFGFVLLFSLNSHAIKLCGFELGTTSKEREEIALAEKQVSTLENIQATIIEYLKESQKSCVKGFGATARFCGYSALEAPQIAWRVWKFDPTMDKTREEVILPLAEMLVKMKSNQISDKDAEKNYFKFITFWPELILKIQKTIPKTTIEVSMSSVTGVIGITEKTDPGVFGAVNAHIRNVILKKFWNTLKTQKLDAKGNEMSYAERLKFALNDSLDFSSQPELINIVNEVKLELGLDKLQEALALYSDRE